MLDDANISKNTIRDPLIDILRGITILLVILGHTISNNRIIGYENTILFKAIFYIQMPMFFCISGYLALSSAKKLINLSSWINYVIKITRSYLLPWFVWTIVIRGLIFGGCTFSSINAYLKYIFFHMDSSYWFLFSLWSICFIWSFGAVVSNEKATGILCSIFLNCVFSGLILCCLLLLGIKLGMAFLGIKLTAYYSPFFFFGFLIGRLEVPKRINNNGNNGKLISLVFPMAAVLFIGFVISFNPYLSDDSFSSVLLRAFGSALGVLTLTLVISSIYRKKSQTNNNGIIERFFLFTGKNSLGIYLSHNYFLNIIKLEKQTPLLSICGSGVCLINYILTVVLSCLFAFIISRNKYLRFILLGKNK